MTNNPYQPQFKLKPTHFIAILLGLIVWIMIIGIIKARAEEPNWDKIVPVIIQIESSGNPNAISKDNCIGLMQVSLMVLKEYNQNYIRNYGNMPNPNFYYITDDLYDEYINKRIGTWYLNRIWNHYLPHYKLSQNIDNLLIAYNFGIGNLVKYRQGRVNLPTETINYLKKFNKLAKAK